MKGILFRPAVWQGKLNTLARFGEAQTRRLGGLKGINKEPGEWELSRFNVGGRLDFGVVHFWNKSDINMPAITIKPHYQIGETVYIKEAWGIDDDDQPIIFYKQETPDWGGKWHSPLFMPERFARYFIKISDVRAEMLQEITEEDAQTEGVEQILWEPDDETNKALARIGAEQVTKPYPVGWRNYLRKFDGRYRYGQPKMYPDMVDSARASFYSLWDSLNEKRGYGWSVNPWVWVISFKIALSP